ncbi:hypothetical protein E2I00_005210 [Balaenoptera physalus]|uniref:Protein LBH n=1 Tax=Balaenoptera physalus TaxID=9770 RepID=A0A643CJ61_BALPH|nr:hypothetical protein E2I00_005210 [Balaenoptera physalus]
MGWPELPQSQPGPKQAVLGESEKELGNRIYVMLESITTWIFQVVKFSLHLDFYRSRIAIQLSSSWRQSPDYLRLAEMTEVMMNTPSMEEIGLNPRKDGLSYQIFPDPSDFDRCCKLKDRLPSIVVEPTEGEVESGELRWPPEEFLVQEDEQDNCEETPNEDKEQ